MNNKNSHSFDTPAHWPKNYTKLFIFNEYIDFLKRTFKAESSNLTRLYENAPYFQSCRQKCIKIMESNSSKTYSNNHAEAKIAVNNIIKELEDESLKYPEAELYLNLVDAIKNFYALVHDDGYNEQSMERKVFSIISENLLAPLKNN